ncbi:MAG: DUF1579 family protein [Acidobacteriota bacterium]
MSVSEPTQAHQKLEKLVGVWKGEETLAPSPWDHLGGTAQATVLNRSALNGLAIVQEYEQERGGTVSLLGHGVFTWDPRQECYLMHWFDSMGRPPNVFTGNFEGDQLVLHHQDEQGHSRALFDFSGSDSYTFQMKVSKDTHHWYTFMEGRYWRQR